MLWSQTHWPIKKWKFTEWYFWFSKLFQKAKFCELNTWIFDAFRGKLTYLEHYFLEYRELFNIKLLVWSNCTSSMKLLKDCPLYNTFIRILVVRLTHKWTILQEYFQFARLPINNRNGGPDKFILGLGEKLHSQIVI